MEEEKYFEYMIKNACPITGLKFIKADDKDGLANTKDQNHLNNISFSDNLFLQVSKEGSNLPLSDFQM